MTSLYMPDSIKNKAGWWSATVILAATLAMLWLAANTSAVWAIPPQNPPNQGTVPPGVCPRTQTFEIENTPVTYNGTWVFNAGVPADSNGRLSLSIQVGATAAFTFTGVSFDLIVRTEPLGGQATVLIDGVPGPQTGPFVVDFSSPTTQYQVLKPLTEGLSNDVHTVLITVAAPAGRVWLDAYRVGNPALGPADLYEPDNGVFEATPVTFNTYMTGRKLDSDSDQDWISFYVQAGEVFTITTYNLAPGTDTALTLYSTDGSTQLAKSDDINWPSNLASRIVYTATVAGTYYAMVTPYPNTGSCLTSYDLSLVKRWKYYLPIMLKSYPPLAPASPPTNTPIPASTSTLGPPPTPTRTPIPGPSPTPTSTSTPVPACAPVWLGTITVGNQPRGVAIDPTRHRIYVANYGSSSISVINSDTQAVVQTITGITAANGVAYDPTHNVLWVSNYLSHQLTPIQANADATGFTVLPPVAVGAGPWGVAYNPTSGNVYVANRDGNSVTVVDGGTRLVETTLGSGFFGQPHHLAVNPVTSKVYVTNFANHSVTVIHGTGDFVSSVVNLNVGDPSTQPYGVAVDETRDLVYVATVNSHRIVVIGWLSGMPDQPLGWAAFHRGFNNPARPVPLRVIAVNPGIGPAGDGGHVWTTTSTADGSEQDQALLIPKGWSSGFAYPVPFNVGTHPSEGIAVDRLTGRVYVTSEGNNTLTVLGDSDTSCAIPFSISGGSLSDEIVSELFKP